jgi:copper ion binding protein
MAVEASFRVQVTVTGMTCQHCAMSVSEEVGEIPGVSTVDVRLDSGAVTVRADREVDRAELASAVSQAGFVLTG